MRLNPVMNKRRLTSLSSFKIHHEFTFFGAFFLSSPLTHIWLIESKVLPYPYHLVMIERVEERDSLSFHYSAYYYSLLIRACHYCRPPDGKLHPFHPQPGESIKMSYFSSSLYIYIYIYILFKYVNISMEVPLWYYILIIFVYSLLFVNILWLKFSPGGFRNISSALLLHLFKGISTFECYLMPNIS